MVYDCTKYFEDKDLLPSNIVLLHWLWKFALTFYKKWNKICGTGWTYKEIKDFTDSIIVKNFVQFQQSNVLSQHAKTFKKFVSVFLLWVLGNFGELYKLLKSKAST